jgi:hypothetical protein
MKKLFKTLFLIVVLSIFLFSDNKAITSARNFCAVNGKALYQKATVVFNNGTKKAVAYFDSRTKK